MPDTISAAVRDDVAILWNYHRLGHELRPTEVGIGLGSHDIGVAVWTAELYHQGLFPLVVFTGANAPTTIDRFPRGEAVHYRERALEEGVPDEVIRVEPKARNTGEHEANSRPAYRRRHHVGVGHAGLAAIPGASGVRDVSEALAGT